MIRKLLLFFSMLELAGISSEAQEILVFDDIITVEEKHNGFYYFQPPENVQNWTEPYDFYNGKALIRYEILDYPSEKGMMLNVCIWADIQGDWESWKETCCPRMSFEQANIYTIESSPSDWWLLNDAVDFSRIPDFDKMGLVVWCYDKRNVSSWMTGDESCWDERADYLPLKLRLTMVLVGQGYQFSGWNRYIQE